MLISNVIFSALVVRYLTKRFIGEYQSGVGKWTFISAVWYRIIINRWFLVCIFLFAILSALNWVRVNLECIDDYVVSTSFPGP